MNDRNWKLCCRLCAKNDTNNIDINLIPDANLSQALNHLFSINLSDPSRQLSTMICQSCHTTVQQFIEFSQKVSRVQTMFSKLLYNNNHFELKELKSQYKIDEESSMDSPIDATFHEPAIQITQEEVKTEIDLFETLKVEQADEEGAKHQTENKQIKCPDCQKIFTNPNSMKRHLRKVHGFLARAVCDECGKACINQSKLDEHKLIHVGSSAFACRECGKCFKNKLRLKYHEDTHSTTSYICTICGIRLNSKPTLNRHMVVHSEEKRFKCDYCGNEYKRAKALKAHMILHTGLRPYSCDFCERTFANASNCRSHKKKSHPIELAAKEAAGEATSYTKVPPLKELRAALEIPNTTDC